MRILWFDTETFSECDLFSAGLHRYAEDPSTEITVAQWAVDDGEPVVEDLTGRRQPNKELRTWLTAPGVLIKAHNAAFDRTVVRRCWDLDIPVDRWYCTMAQALSHGMPGGLEKVGEALGIKSEHLKDKRGKDLIQLFCKPRPKNHTLRRATRQTHPKEWADFLEYSRQDIVAMRAICTKLPSWNYKPGHAELDLWRLDQEINDRGFAVDLDLARAAVEAVAKEQTRLKQETSQATGGAVTSPSKRDQLLAFILAEYGVTLPDMKADTLRRRVEDPDLPDGVKLLLSLRLEATKASTAKYKALLKAANADSRLRGTLQFAGAQRTARWAGRIFQPQNLLRPDESHIAGYLGLPSLSKDDHEKARQVGDYLTETIDALKHGVADIVVDNVMQLTANLGRSCIVAPPGKKLVISDLSNIEGRMLAWLSGESWKIKAFAEYDKGIGRDLYKLAYAQAFNVEPDGMSKAQRQIGKVMELACFGAETPVLTNNGVKSLSSVTTGDQLWDGVEWVEHCGVVRKGVRQVLNLAGVEVTPDHLMLTRQTWRPAAQLVSNERHLCQALETGSLNLPSSGLKGTWSASSAPVAPLRTSSTTTTLTKAQARDATSAPKRKPELGEKTFGPTRTSCLTTTTEGVCSTEYPQPPRVATPRRQDNTQPTGAEVSTFGGLGGKIGGPFSLTSSPWKAGTSQPLTSTESTSTKAMSQAIYASSRPAKTEGETSEQSHPSSSESMSLKPVFDILNAGPRRRFTILTERGPLIVHNCGYEGGVAAFLTFAAVYGMDLDALAEAVWDVATEDAIDRAKGMLAWFQKHRRSTHGLSEKVWIACEILVLAWRDAHSNTKALWAAARDAVTQAIGAPGTSYRFGKYLVARKDGTWLRIRLPSGRYLCYLHPEVNDKGEISYTGVDPYTRQWRRTKTYGGKLIENCTQAAARDVLAGQLQPINDAGYSVVLTVHDEVLCETPDSPEFNVEDLSGMLSAVPPWAAGLPLAAAGFETKVYHKE